ncbi:FAD-dependent monooxygenase [Micromonospora sp. DT233]|uniref:FAD-dependent monooxygenase n=1 Tax=Micromonospora sp. DT233 TaxID=3393432 RepID=UPI003CE8852C
MNQPVIIAGAGGTGLMLACELGLAGVPAVVLERLPERPRRSPSLSMHVSSPHLFRQRGLDWFDDAPQIPRYNFGFLGHVQLDPDYTPLLVPQRRVERLLEERATDLGVDVRRGHELVGLAQDEAGVTVTVRQLDGSEYQLTGSHLMGCDGGRSRVRKLAGIEFPGTGATLSGMTGDVVFADGEGGGILPAIHQGGLVSVAPHPEEPDTFRATAIEFDTVPGDRDTPVTPAEFAEAFARISGIELNIKEIPYATRFANRTHQATRYRDGRVFLAGDATKVHFISGGLGLTCGLQDAVNLGWKLAATRAGWAPPGLLDTYHAERHPIGQWACRHSRASVALYFPLNQMGPLRHVFNELLKMDEVSAYLLGKVSGLSNRYAMETGGRDHPLLGARVPDAALDGAGDHARTVYQTLHAGRGVVLDLTGGPAPADLARWGDRVDVVTAHGAAGLDAATVLVRPDGHVAHVDVDGTDANGLRRAIGAWFGAPAPAGVLTPAVSG